MAKNLPLLSQVASQDLNNLLQKSIMLLTLYFSGFPLFFLTSFLLGGGVLAFSSLSKWIHKLTNRKGWDINDKRRIACLLCDCFPNMSYKECALFALLCSSLLAYGFRVALINCTLYSFFTVWRSLEWTIP